MTRSTVLESEKIEVFFLTNLLRITLGGVLIILVVDLIFSPTDLISISIDVAILLASSFAYWIRLRYQNISVLFVAIVVTAAMFYQCLSVPFNTTTSISILLIVGFVVSVILKGKLMWATHVMVFVTMNSVFVIQFRDTVMNLPFAGNDIITISVTYSILYVILTFAARVLKVRYDKAIRDLRELFSELHLKTEQVNAKNSELILAQKCLASLNDNLEQKVRERNAKLQEKTEKLIKYSWVNAHHLRGPVARLLGLITLRKMEEYPDEDFFFEKVRSQALEIDEVIRRINGELETIDQGDVPKQ